MFIAILAVLAFVFAATSSAEAQIAAPQGRIQSYETVPMEQVQTIEQLEAQLQTALQPIIDATPVAEWSIEEFKAFQEISKAAVTMRNLLLYRQQLRNMRADLARQASAAPGDASFANALQTIDAKLLESKQLSDVELLKLQSEIQSENRQVILVSCIGKKRRDTAKRAIENMRS